MKNIFNKTIYTLLVTVTLLAAPMVSCAKESDPSSTPTIVSGDVMVYTTTASGGTLFQNSAVDYSTVSMSPYRIDLIDDGAYDDDEIIGFGPAITGSTCYNLLRMSSSDRATLLNKCFDPTEGLGFSFVRVHIGGSDFSMDEYTCWDDPDADFAIPQIEKSSIWVILNEILNINPEVRILGSPWSCPKWMKVEVDDLTTPYDSWTSGRLNPEYYDEYADYFIKWIEEMEDNGFPIHAITLQNEPLNQGNSMSLYMPWEDQRDFLKVLGPKFAAQCPDIKILAYDHNYDYDGISDQYDYPVKLYQSEVADYIDGSAWHNYGGDVSTLDGIYNAFPQKSIYFTEASIGEWNYSFSSSLITDFSDIFIGTLSRHGRAVLLWNMMLDDQRGPYRPGGCSTCYGAIEISSSNYKSLKYNTHYYNLAHCSKVIKPGAVRISTDGFTTSGLEYLAFKNSDGSYAVIAVNSNSESVEVSIHQSEDKAFRYVIPLKSIVSFSWK